MDQKRKEMKGKTGEKKELLRLRFLRSEAQTVLSELEDEGWQSLMVVWVAGAAYVDWERLYAPLKAGEQLGLRREPENPYDAMAIMVIDDNGEKLGYIPRAENCAAAQKLDAGEDAIAVLLKVDRESCIHFLYIDVYTKGDDSEASSG